MVFHSLSESEAPPPLLSSKPTMASSTFSAKTHQQPLHNFPLSNLKWSMNHSNDHRLRKLADPTHPEFRHLSPDSDPPRKLADSGERSELRCVSSSSSGKNDPRFIKLQYPTPNSSGWKKDLESNDRGVPVRRSVKRGLSAFASEEVIEKSVRKAVATASTFEILEKKLESSGGNEEEKSLISDQKKKIFIRIRSKAKADSEGPEAEDEKQLASEAEEVVPKTWNLRPRRTITNKSPNSNGGAPGTAGALVSETKPEGQTQIQSDQPRNNTEGASQRKKKFCLSLSKEEIEEDILALTGSKPSRRPKKRAKNVQRQLDGLFPGMWLSYVRFDSYRVDPPLKG